MFAVFPAARKWTRRAAILAAAALLAACEPVALGGNTGRLIDTSAPVQVALLVPGGSGQAGDDVVARALENAARLAIADLSDVEVDLRVYNTAGQPEQAAAAATRAVDDGARIILGPVFGEAANAAGVAVARRNINVLSFSNNTAIAGGNVFVLGPTFENTAARMMSHAVARGRGSVMVVYDQTQAGEAGRRAIEAAAGRTGARLAAVTGYPFSFEGIIDTVPTIGATARASGANALFFTDTTDRGLLSLTQLLAENGTGPDVFQYLGLTRWDIPPSTLAQPSVQGAWFALPDPALSAQFVSRYTAAYGTGPHPIAGLAYDGIAAIGALVRAGRGDALTRDALTQPSGFVGVSGIFRLNPDGTNQRGLAVAEIRDNQVIVIDPAPRSFSDAGF
ncbi:MAG: penicillin-binding protein activator [Rhodobacteraceae bacterium]|nr:penicillin-binding protein activator [Paracoccaceae bacterium]